MNTNMYRVIKRMQLYTKILQKNVMLLYFYVDTIWHEKINFSYFLHKYKLQEYLHVYEINVLNCCKFNKYY